MGVEDGALAVVVQRLRASGSVYAEDEAALLVAEASSPAALEAMVVQRVAGLPLEVVVGWAEFCGLRIVSDPGVFVPRRRTELLVREAVGLVMEGAAPVVVDLCCGTGAVGVAVHAALVNVDLWSADVEPSAVRCARKNIEPVGGTVLEGDLFEPLPRSLWGRVDLLLVNAPYVPSGSIALMPPEARLHEPMVALDGGADGLDLHRRVAVDARGWLAPGGSVLIETSRQQAPRTAAVLADNDMVTKVVMSDELDATVAIGQRLR